jgi:hypothetical protein
VLHLHCKNKERDFKLMFLRYAERLRILIVSIPVPEKCCGPKSRYVGRLKRMNLVSATE